MAGWQRQPALARAVNAMMRALGGATVTLRIPAATDGGTQRELGIAAAAYQEAEVAPVLVREVAKSKSKAADEGVRATQAQEIEVLISSSGLDMLMPAFGVTDGTGFLRMAKQIVYAGIVFSVTEVSADRFAGVEYMYRVTAVSTQ